AAEREIDVVRRHQLEPGPALEEERRRRLLMELRLDVRDPRERDRKVAGLEEDLGVAALVLLPVEDVLEVESGDPEQRRRPGFVGQLVDPVVPVAALVVVLVVADDRRQVPGLKRLMRHVFTTKAQRTQRSLLNGS